MTSTLQSTTSKQVAIKEPFVKLARLGYGARGVVYLTVGGLALLTAFGSGGEVTDSKGAISAIKDQPLGEILLTILILGLVGYAIWRFTQSLKDTDSHGHSFQGVMIRGALLASAITHTALAIWATSLLFSGGGGGGSSRAAEEKQTFLSSELGQVTLGILGFAIIVAGVVNLYKGYTARFERYMSLPSSNRGWLRPVCRFGLAARGIVWMIVGAFILQSVWQANNGTIAGMDDAMNALQQAVFGQILLGITAAGLFAFGIYSILEAVYRRIQTG